jgi:hypothetical protein
VSWGFSNPAPSTPRGSWTSTFTNPRPPTEDAGEGGDCECALAFSLTNTSLNFCRFPEKWRNDVINNVITSDPYVACYSSTSVYVMTLLIT